MASKLFSNVILLALLRVGMSIQVSPTPAEAKAASPKAAASKLALVYTRGDPDASAKVAESISKAPAATQCSGATCSVYEDPHVEVFDGVQISLIAATDHSTGECGDKWLVRSDRISIQARYLEDKALPERNVFVRAIAVGGAFLEGNIVILGSLVDEVTWNGKPILEEEDSEFSFVSSGDRALLVKARRGANSSHAENPSVKNHGIDIEFPLGTSLVVNRLYDHVNFAITMSQRDSGQDGLCGNFNCIASDDNMGFLAERSSIDVLPSESLFMSPIGADDA